MDSQAFHDQIDYGPLCKGTWQDYSYPSCTNLGDINLTQEQPTIRNMTQAQVDSINVAWDKAFGVACQTGRH